MTAYYQNPYLPHRLRAGAPTPTKKLAKVTLDSRGLPVGTAAQVIDWVDEDPDRAQRFLIKEQQETRPRVSLVANLKAVLKRNEVEPAEASPPAAPVVAETEESIDPLALVRDRLGVEAS